MKWYKRILLYYKLAQFLAVLYIRRLQKNPSQYIWKHRKDQQISIKAKRCRYGYQRFLSFIILEVIYHLR